MPELTRIVNLKEFRSKLRKLDEVVRNNAMTEAVSAGGFELEAEIKLNIEAQNLVDTGNLMNSVQLGSVSAKGNKAEVTVGTNVIYAAIHEFGGTIVARNAKALVFKTKDGIWHRVKSVTIPARPFMRPALDNGLPRIKEAMIAILEKWIYSI